MQRCVLFIFVVKFYGFLETEKNISGRAFSTLSNKV